MKCLSLHQPWATAIALGFKRIETRSWAHSWRGEIAIHAAKNTSALRDGTMTDLSAMTDGAFGEYLPGDPTLYPLGAVVAVARLVDCVPTSIIDDHERWRGLRSDINEIYGNYMPGRFGWILENVRALREPFPLRGQQGLWTITREQADAVVALAGGRMEVRQ